MQLEDPGVLETSSGEVMMAAPPEAATAANGGAEIMNNSVRDIAANSGDDEKRIEGGNRWPRQETFALLKIRSDMDAAFRDSTLKGPLWDEISRKLAELGYNRSSKKCKEKFENVYKYHKRTKENRSGKPEGKTYKFFDQLQALENQFTISHSHTPKPQPSQPQPHSSFSTRPTNDPTTVTTTITSTLNLNPTLISPPTNVATTTTTTPNPRTLPNVNLFSSTTTTSTSSSTASDEDMDERYRKKRKLKDYFRRLTRQVLAKQEEMQKKFLEAIDKRERERAAQQEAWRLQEMARINREHDILVQERSTAAAKDAAVIAFLQKLSGGHQNPPNPPTSNPPPPPVTQVVQAVQPRDQQPQYTNNGHHQSGSSCSPSSRWPKAEVHALIRLRTILDTKYQENGPKGPLWEDISAGMQRLGYNRSSKRCKEKWENINKYFKKMRESNKQRREDSKTCPYFHELEALYNEKNKANHNPFGTNRSSQEMMMEPLMVQPEQQWRPPPLEDGGGAREHANINVGEREGQEEEEEEEDDMVEDGESVEDDREEGRRYEMEATNKLPSVDTVE